MDPKKRKQAESWIDQAGTHLTTARERVQSYFTYPEAVQAAQACIELSVKVVLVFLGIDFAKSHGWGEKHMQALAEQIRTRKLLEQIDAHSLQPSINLPRLIMLANFWGEFYLLAKYGMEAGSLATPDELFQREEAELAIRHAEECMATALRLRYPDSEQMKQLLS